MAGVCRHTGLLCFCTCLLNLFQDRNLEVSQSCWPWPTPCWLHHFRFGRSVYPSGEFWPWNTIEYNSKRRTICMTRMSHCHFCTMYGRLRQRRNISYANWILSDRNLRYPFAKRGADDQTTRMELPDDIHYKRANTFPTCDIDVLAQVKYITIWLQVSICQMPKSKRRRKMPAPPGPCPELPEDVYIQVK